MSLDTHHSNIDGYDSEQQRSLLAKCCLRRVPLGYLNNQSLIRIIITHCDSL